MKKYLILSFFLLAILAIWHLLPDNKSFKSVTGVIKTKAEPQFFDEGNLYFLNHSDTLSEIDIEIADEYEEIAKGLMYRSRLLENQGMLFIFNHESEQSFWMKNTKIPLDILYVNKDFQIVRIAKHTVPYSKEPIPSIEPAIYVIEVNAGYCDLNDITLGNKISYIRNDARN